MKLNMDIDIDFKNRDDILKILPHTPAAAIRDNGKIDKHNSGVYFQNIPIDPETEYSSIDYKNAELTGYMKFDFINNHLYQNVVDLAHLDRLVNTEPNWELFTYPEIVSTLHQLSNHTEITSKFAPTSLDELAALIALIRPGKSYLRNEPKEIIMQKIWLQEADDTYTFKKSHSYAYALSLIVQLNVLVEKLLDNNDEI